MWWTILWTAVALVVVAILITVIVLLVRSGRKKAEKEEAAKQAEKEEAAKRAESEEAARLAELLEELSQIASQPENEEEEQPVEEEEPEPVKQEVKEKAVEEPQAKEEETTEEEEEEAEDVEVETPSADKAKKTVKSYHISKRKSDGMWQIKLAGGKKAIKLFRTQQEAIDYCKVLAENQDAKVTVHKKDGSFRKQNY